MSQTPTGREATGLAGRLASHFAHPRGILGRLTGFLMVRGNGDFVRWSVDRLAARVAAAPGRVAEIGSGPGIGLEAALAAFPGSTVVGIDPSPEMLGTARRRNRDAIAQGRLVLVGGEAEVVVEHGPFDLLFCTHVIYFWDDPVGVLRSIRSALRPGGVLGIGYQLAEDMPALAREQFPRLGHIVYESDEQLDRVILAAGFSVNAWDVKGPAGAPHGRLVVARPRVSG